MFTGWPQNRTSLIHRIEATVKDKLKLISLFFLRIFENKNCVAVYMQLINILGKLAQFRILKNVTFDGFS